MVEFLLHLASAVVHALFGAVSAIGLGGRPPARPGAADAAETGAAGGPIPVITEPDTD